MARKERDLDIFIEKTRKRKNDDELLRLLFQKKKKFTIRGKVIKEYYDDPVKKMLGEQK